MWLTLDRDLSVISSSGEIMWRNSARRSRLHYFG
jgi:hypothetical protein